MDINDYYHTSSRFNGMPVIINNTRLGSNIKRSWKERLFSLPWRPLLKEYFDPEEGDYMVATGTVINAEDKLYMNKITFNKIIGIINAQIDEDIMKFPYEK